MQTVSVYAIHDAAAGAFGTPFFMVNDLMAIRAFSALVNEKDHLFNSNPTDFILFHIAKYDAYDAQITSNDVPRRVRIASALLITEENEAQHKLFNKNELAEQTEDSTEEITNA